jgi:hypothetical protein
VVLSSNQRTRVGVKVSPGPWWGFNGVDTLELRNGLFVRSFRMGRHGSVSRIYEIDEVVIESHGVARRRGRNWSTLVLVLAGKRQRFIGFPAAVEPFVAELKSATSQH